MKSSNKTKTRVKVTLVSTSPMIQNAFREILYFTCGTERNLRRTSCRV